MPGLTDPCAIASERYFDKRRWLNLWTLLLWIFGATIILFLVIAITLFIRSTWLPAAVSLIGTIVSGAGIGWVLQRRTDAEKEERDAFTVLTDTYKEKTSFGPRTTGFQNAYPTPEQIKDLAWKSLISGTPGGLFGP
jgi:hypothetical protein